MENGFDLDAALSSLDGRQRLLICPHDDPDPDAIAAAWAMSLLLETTLGAEVTIGFEGIIGRAENRAMVRELSVPLRRLAVLDSGQFDGVVLVDTQPGFGNHSAPTDPPVVACVDHHSRGDGGKDVAWYDVRPDAETTSTIALGYLIQAGIEVKPPLATAILYALKTDTQDFSRGASDRDLAAYRYVFERADHRILGAIVNPRLDPTYFRILRDAIERTQIYDHVAVLFFDTLAYPDLVAEMADFFVRRRGTDWALCGGVFGETLRFSLRTENERARAGTVARMLAVPRGGSAGGHGATAGGQIPLSVSPGKEPPSPDLPHQTSPTAREIWADLAANFLRRLGVDDEGHSIVEG